MKVRGHNFYYAIYTLGFIGMPKSVFVCIREKFVHMFKKLIEMNRSDGHGKICIRFFSSDQP